MTKTHFFAPPGAARLPRPGGSSENSSDTAQSRARGSAGAIPIASGNGGPETSSSADDGSGGSSKSRVKPGTRRR